MSVKAIKFDRKKCTACAACAMACMDEKNTDVEQGEKALRQVYVEEIVREGEISFRFHSDSCVHCKKPVCVKSCPEGCLFKEEESGLVLFDRKNCTGCKKCASACPREAISFDLQGKISKCDGCVERQRQGKIPACVRVCPTGALFLDE